MALATLSSLLCCALAAPMGWLVARTDMPLRRVVRLLVTASFVTPPFLGAFAWVLLGGPNAGLLNQWYYALFGLKPFEAAPLVEMVRGRQVQVGFTISLYARLPQEALLRGDASFFKPLLPPNETWRLYREFADRAVFLDIETTGLSPWGDEVTMIGALGGGKLSLFVRGMNLDHHGGVRRIGVEDGQSGEVQIIRGHMAKEQ